MQRVKIAFIILLMFGLSAYAYIWFSAAENIKASFEREINNANLLGLEITIDDFKYSGFPFEVSVTAKNPTLKVKNPISGISYFAKIPNIGVWCDLFIKSCTVNLDQEKNIEISNQENSQKIMEVKFASGLKAHAVMDRSYLIASLMEEKLDFENLIAEMNLYSDSIIVHNSITNQDVSKVSGLRLSELYNYNPSKPLITSLNLKFNILNPPLTNYYLAEAFNNLDVAINFNINKDKQDKAKTLNLEDISIKLDNAICKVDGKLSVNEQKLPVAINIRVNLDNYDYLIQKYLSLQHKDNKNEIDQDYSIFKSIVEKITATPYKINKANFDISLDNTEGKNNIMVGKTSLAEIFKTLMTKYREKTQ